jgi:LEA14-like dessication related protein
VKKYLAFLFLVGTLVSGCTSVFVKEPVVTVKDLNIISVDTAGAVMELYIEVKNENDFDLKLLGYSYDLHVMALPLVKGGAREEISFPGRQSTDLRIPLRVSYADLLALLRRNPNPDRVPYQLKAGLDLDTPVGHVNVPVDKKGTYSIPKQYRPSYYLNKLRGFFGGRSDKKEASSDTAEPAKGI